MRFKDKKIKVIIVKEIEQEFNELKNIVKKSNNQIILKSIQQKITILKEDPEYGIHISKSKILKEYIQKYNINNLWKVNLSGYWRMLYTIKSNEVEIISLILDLIDHKKYNKKFGYRKN